MRQELVDGIQNFMSKVANARVEMQKTAAFRQRLSTFMKLDRQYHQEKTASIRSMIRKVAGK